MVHDGGQDDAQWAEVLFNLEPQGTSPAGTSIHFQIRAANVEAGLAASPWVEVEGTQPTQPVAGRSYELRARMIADPDLEVSPVLSDVCVTTAP